MRPSELEVIRRALPSQDDAVEAVVVFEAAEQLEAEAVAIEAQQSVEIVARPRDA
jgi:hypothetical protein